MSAGKTYRIRDWQKYFETVESRRIRHTRWVPVPVKHDGKGYRRLIGLKRGAEYYAAWLLIVQVAAKCPIRGTLADEDGPLSHEDLAMKTGCQASIFEAAITPLLGIGWLEEIEPPCNPQGTPCYLQETPCEPQVIALQSAGHALPEGKGREGNIYIPPPIPPQTPAAKPPKPEELAEIWNTHRGAMRRVSLPLNADRKRHARARLAEAPDLERWKAAIVRAAKTKLCQGLVPPKEDGGKPWIGNFEWLLRPNTLARIEEGVYDSQPPRRPSAPATPVLSDAEREFLASTGTTNARPSPDPSRDLP